MTFIQRSLLLIGLFSILTISCKKAHDHDHLDIAGFRIIANNEVVAQQSGTTVTGTLSIIQGQTTGEMTVEFLDPEGFILNITDDDFRLQVDPVNASAVSVQAGTGRWGFRLTGNTTGSTTVTVKLMHGSHADFESRPVSVNILPAP